MRGIPKSHPRRKSLETRERLVEGFKNGLVCLPGLIAQGRGEAFDYLLGEKTAPFAKKAAEAAACELLLAEKPVISVNGNLAALCPREIARLARATGTKLEVNLFYRTGKRVERIRKALLKAGADEVLGGKGDSGARIPELFSQRRRVSKRGIYLADVVLLALEDGDRTRALRRMGKKVIAIDLNPLSVTAQSADITIVDNVVRAVPLLCKAVAGLRGRNVEELRKRVAAFDNKKTLQQAFGVMRGRLGKLATGGRP